MLRSSSKSTFRKDKKADWSKSDTKSHSAVRNVSPIATVVVVIVVVVVVVVVQRLRPTGLCTMF